MGMDPGDELPFILFESKGTTILFDTRSPTASQLENCMHIHLTTKTPWNPRKVCFSRSRKHRVEEVETASFDELDFLRISATNIWKQTNLRAVDSEPGLVSTVNNQAEFTAWLIESI